MLLKPVTFWQAGSLLSRARHLHLVHARTEYWANTREDYVTYEYQEWVVDSLH